MTICSIPHPFCDEGQPFDGEAGAAHAQTWEELYTFFGETWPEQILLEGHNHGSVAKARSTVKRTVAEATLTKH
jgi:hypothetical protein